MRIWDINPGYLNDKSLLGEHVELHGLASIIVNNKKGYSKHPETKRWVDYLGSLKKRHDLLVSEMALRGFEHNSPLKYASDGNHWPKIYIDEPQKQFEILNEKYRDKKIGRIPLPISAQNLWSQHKYSVMARDLNEYKKIGNFVSKMKPNECFFNLSKELVELLRSEPTLGGIENSLQHMWGYFKKEKNNFNIESLDLDSLLLEIQKYAYLKKEKYILESTALSELKVWI
tara:strand:- start:110 stop:799 length:690 start_codon:yes stop_codon:yes gene_type:complete